MVIKTAASKQSQASIKKFRGSSKGLLKELLSQRKKERKRERESTF